MLLPSKYDNSPGSYATPLALHCASLEECAPLFEKYWYIDPVMVSVDVPSDMKKDRDGGRGTKPPENFMTTPFTYYGNALFDIKMRHVPERKKAVALANSRLHSNAILL